MKHQVGTGPDCAVRCTAGRHCAVVRSLPPRGRVWHSPSPMGVAVTVCRGRIDLFSNKRVSPLVAALVGGIWGALALLHSYLRSEFLNSPNTECKSLLLLLPAGSYVMPVYPPRYI